MTSSIPANTKSPSDLDARDGIFGRTEASSVLAGLEGTASTGVGGRNANTGSDGVSAELPVVLKGAINR
jgi:hypothetical protein